MNQTNGKQSLGEQIKAMRTLRGMTQEELGEAIGVSHVVISNLETGKVMPNDSHMERIKAALDWQVHHDTALEMMAQ